MVYLLKPAVEKAGIKLKEVKGEERGRCEFCGREAELTPKKVFMRWLKGASNPGISKVSRGIPGVCTECFSVLTSAIRPSALTKAFEDSSLIISGYADTGVPIAVGIKAENALELAEKIGSIPEGLYVTLFFLRKGNFLPIVDLPYIEATVAPEISLTINIVQGSMMEKQTIPTPLLYEKEPKGVAKTVQKRILKGGR